MNLLKNRQVFKQEKSDMKVIEMKNIIILICADVDCQTQEVFKVKNMEMIMRVVFHSALSLFTVCTYARIKIC